MNKKNKKYRLRLNDRIVGFAEETKNGLLFKGKEVLWFMRGRPNYNEIDECIGIKDSFHRDVYEMDIVNYKINDASMARKGVILWEKNKQTFGIYDVESKHFTHIFIEDLCLFTVEKLEIVSHLFNYPQLEETLGLKNI